MIALLSQRIALASLPMTVPILLLVAWLLTACNYPIQTPLHTAIKAGDLSKVEQLIAAGADTEERIKGIEAPLHTAVSFARARIVSALLKAGVDVNAVEQNKRTALHWAALTAYIDPPYPPIIPCDRRVGDNHDDGQIRLTMIGMLLDAGTDPALRDRDGLTAQDIALKYGRCNAARLLQVAN